MKDGGEFFVCSMPISRKRVCSIIFLPREPLTVSFYLCCHKCAGMMSGGTEADCCLDGIISEFGEVCFPETPFSCGAVSHGQSAVAWVKASGAEVYPWRHDHRYLSKLFDVRNFRSGGSCHLHAHPHRTVPAIWRNPYVPVKKEITIELQRSSQCARIASSTPVLTTKQ